MYPHRIRLRGPWDVGTDGRRVIMPATWSELGGAVSLVRRFGAPRTDPDESVSLIVVQCRVKADLRLNGESFGRLEPGTDRSEFEATTRLRGRNELEVTVHAGEPAALVWDDLALEIRGPYALRGVSLSRTAAAGFRVTGEVVGGGGGLLEVYVLRNGRTAGYERVEAGPQGRGFVVDVPGEPPEGRTNPQYPEWRVELVGGANRWYVIDVEPAAPTVR